MTPQIAIILIAALAAVLGGVYWLNRRRQQPVAALAAANGWRYTPRPFSPRFQLAAGEWELHPDPRCLGVLHWRSKTAVLSDALLLIHGKETPPQLSLELSGDVAGTLAGWAAARVEGELHQVFHGSDLFLAQYAIRSTDETAVARLISPAVQQALLDWMKNGRSLPILQIGPQGVKLTTRLPITPANLTALIHLGQTLAQPLLRHSAK